MRPLFQISDQEVRELREKSGEGLAACKQELERRRINKAVMGIRCGNHDWRLVADILDLLNARGRGRFGFAADADG